MVEATSVAQAAEEYSSRLRAQANADADSIVKKAQEQGDAYILDSQNKAASLMQDAQDKAAAIKKNTEEWETNIRLVTTKFVSNIMQSSDDVLSANIAEIRKARQTLQAAIADKQ